MADIRVAAQRQIDAPADDVYAILADYREQHPRILPDAFSDYRVESGGTGAGTIVSFRLTAGGRSRSYRMEVSEPEPGRVLQESDQTSHLVTTFRVIPEITNCLVQIETVWPGSGGVGGFFERTFAPRVLKRIYINELERLDQLARGQTVQ